MKAIAVVQARMGSVRLPGKVLMPIAGIPAIDLLLQRLRNAKSISKIIVATSTSQKDDILAEHLKKNGVSLFRGEEFDVLSRFVNVSSVLEPNVIVRITGDCPFTDPTLVDSVVGTLAAQGLDYCSNVEPPTFPHGMDVEAFTPWILNWTKDHVESQRAKEHVTTLMRETASIRKGNLSSGGEYSHIRVTLDNPEDLEVMRNVANAVTNVVDFGWSEIVDIHRKNPELFLTNSRYVVRGSSSPNEPRPALE